MQSTVTPRKFILYPYAPWFFALAIAVTVTGFSRSYFSRLSDVTIFHHIHGATAGAWMLLLIMQPILYRKGKLALHRRLGWIAAFTLVPLLILGGLKMIRLMFDHPGGFPPGIPYRLAFIDAYSLIFFLMCFILAIRNSRKLHTHARYMVCTILIVLPPALTRLLFLLPWFHNFDQTLNGSFFIVELILLLLIIDDRRTGRIYRPYPLALVLFVILHIAMNFCANWGWWRTVMDSYARLNF